MSTFAIKCPHCFKDEVAFTVRHFVPTQRADGRCDMETFATCNHCHRGVTATITTDSPCHIDALPGNLYQYKHLHIGEWLPRVPLPDVPDRLPPAVQAVFLEAEQLRLAKFHGPAGNAYRRALEAAMIDLDITTEGTLYERVERLASQGILTSGMQKFAHRIRALGNMASHETFSESESNELRLFTKLFMMYLFTLPSMLPDDVK